MWSIKIVLRKFSQLLNISSERLSDDTMLPTCTVKWLCLRDTKFHEIGDFETIQCCKVGCLHVKIGPETTVIGVRVHVACFHRKIISYNKEQLKLLWSVLEFVRSIFFSFFWLKSCNLFAQTCFFWLASLLVLQWIPFSLSISQKWDDRNISSICIGTSVSTSWVAKIPC